MKVKIGVTSLTVKEQLRELGQMVIIQKHRINYARGWTTRVYDSRRTRLVERVQEAKDLLARHDELYHNREHEIEEASQRLVQINRSIIDLTIVQKYLSLKEKIEAITGNEKEVVDDEETEEVIEEIEELSQTETMAIAEDLGLTTELRSSIDEENDND